MRNTISRGLLLSAMLLAAGAAAAGSQDKGSEASSGDEKVSAGAKADVAVPEEEDAADAEDAAIGDAPAGEKPLILRSLLLAPEQAGAFRLVDFEDYPGRPEMGVGAQYRHDDFPEVIISLFVYPFGDFGRPVALDALVDLTRRELEAVEREGKYESLVFGDATDIDLQRIDSDGSPLPVRDGLLGRSDSLTIDTAAAKRDLDAAIASEAARVEEHIRAATDPDLGRRVPVRFRLDGIERQSVAFLFHRSLYAFKARVSSPMGLSPDSFDRLANQAMAAIVPAVQVRNIGRCSEFTIELDPDADPDHTAVMLVAKSVVARVQGERRGCANTLDETVPAGMRAIALDVARVFEG